MCNTSMNSAGTFSGVFISTPRKPLHGFKRYNINKCLWTYGNGGLQDPHKGNNKHCSWDETFFFWRKRKISHKIYYSRSEINNRKGQQSSFFWQYPITSFHKRAIIMSFISTLKKSPSMMHLPTHLLKKETNRSKFFHHTTRRTIGSSSK